jgi:hypothetical protein
VHETGARDAKMQRRVYDVGTRIPEMRLPIAMMDLRVDDVGARIQEMRGLIPKMGASVPETDPPIPETRPCLRQSGIVMLAQPLGPVGLAPATWPTSVVSSRTPSESSRWKTLSVRATRLHSSFAVQEHVAATTARGTTVPSSSMGVPASSL